MEGITQVEWEASHEWLLLAQEYNNVKMNKEQQYKIEKERKSKRPQGGTMDHQEQKEVLKGILKQ